MEMTVFARFHAREGQGESGAALMRNQLGPVRAEPGCLTIEAYRSTRDPRAVIPDVAGRPRPRLECSVVTASHMRRSLVSMVAYERTGTLFMFVPKRTHPSQT